MYTEYRKNTIIIIIIIIIIISSQNFKKAGRSGQSLSYGLGGLWGGETRSRKKERQGEWLGQSVRGFGGVGDGNEMKKMMKARQGKWRSGGRRRDLDFIYLDFLIKQKGIYLSPLFFLDNLSLHPPGKTYP